MAALPQLTKDHGKLVITVALTGNLNTKERNPSLPCTPQEIADQVHNCAQLGATVFHIHARDENNKPTMHVPVFREICRLVKQRDPDVIIQISTGGRAGGGHNWRIDPLNLLPEMGSFTTGTVNLGAIVYENSPKLIEDLAQKYKETGIKPQIEVFDTSILSNARQLQKEGKLPRPLDFGFVMGAQGAQACDLRQLGYLVSLLEPGDTWNSIGIGKFSLPLATTAIMWGGHVRVGLEDTNKMLDGSLATNEKMVEYVVNLAKTLGRQIATPDEARDILGLPKEWKDRILPQLDDGSGFIKHLEEQEAKRAAADKA
ncbi:MAG: hypothetical protein SGPRY_012449 [Prymnesium sp.]